MKPSPFVYHRPRTVAEAVRLLAEHDSAKVLAGGQSLVPILNMRLAAPKHIVDVNAVEGLAELDVTPGRVVVGALVRHRTLERSDPAYAVQPLLRRALQLVAHPVIRNRGTTVGSLVHADPAAEMPAVLALTGGSVRLVSASGEREVAAGDLVVGPLESALRPDELAVSATFPAFPADTGTAVLETSRRNGDYALCGVAVALTAPGRGPVSRARAAFFAVDAVPVVVDLPSLVGRDVAALDDAARGEAGQQAAAGLAPEADLHATADYRRHLAAVLTARAVDAAAADLRPVEAAA